MSLKEIRNGSEKVYQDDVRLPQSQWARLIGVSPMSFCGALRKVNLQAEPIDPNDLNGHTAKAVRVAEFPRVIKGFKNKKTGRVGRRFPAHQWAQIKDLNSDFEVNPPSGAILIYEYQ